MPARTMRSISLRHLLFILKCILRMFRASKGVCVIHIRMLVISLIKIFRQDWVELDWVVAGACSTAISSLTEATICSPHKVRIRSYPGESTARSTSVREVLRVKSSTAGHRLTEPVRATHLFCNALFPEIMVDRVG
jgi:hypothetical protein